MFEVNLLSPTQFGAFIPWLVVHHGPLSVLVHPNYEVEDALVALENHTERAVWMGERVPLDVGLFHLMKERQEQQKEKEKEATKVNGET
jgi:aromatic ring-cleaving dioxygenase